MQDIMRRAIALRLAGQPTSAACCLQQLAGFAKEATGKKGGGEGGGDNRLQALLKAMEPATPIQVELSAEEAAEAERRGKEYSRLKMQEHRQWQTDLTTKLKLKQAAIDALPPELREAALVPDFEPFPSNRQVWTETPPVEEGADAGAKKQSTRTARSIGTKRR